MSNEPEAMVPSPNGQPKKFPDLTNTEKAFACANDAMNWAHMAVQAGTTPSAVAIPGSKLMSREQAQILASASQTLASLALYYQRRALDDVPYLTETEKS